MTSHKNGTAYATKDDLRVTAAQLRSELASKAELQAVKTELKDDIRGVGIMVERLESKLIAFAEGLGGQCEGIRRDMQAMEERLGARISALESVVRAHSSDIHALQHEVAELRRRFDERDRLDEIEQRVAVLEKRLAP